MPVEFHCSGCAKLLRTPDESAGKKAKCPQCGAIVDVPLTSQSPGEATEPEVTASPSDSPFAAPTGEAPATSEGFNPYASPTTDSTLETRYTPKGDLEHRLIEFDPIMKKTWAFFSQNLGPLALFGLVVFALNAGLQVVNQLGTMALQAVGDEYLIIAFAVVNGLIGFAFQAYISVAACVYMLKMTRTRQAKLNDIFLANPFFLRAVGLQILLALIFVGVLAICMLPALISLALEAPPISIALAGLGAVIYLVLAIILGIRYSLISFFFLVDRDSSVGGALSASATFMQGNKGTTFLVALVVGFLGTLFMICTCFFGQILYIPYFSLLTTIIYLSVTGQPWDEPEV